MAEGSAAPALLLVGCGNMGRALLRGWVRDWSGPIHVVDPQVPTDSVGPHCHHHSDPTTLPDNLAPAALLLAVKPQMLGAVLPAYAIYAARGALVISIAAGAALATLSAGLGGTDRIVRVMPNTPAAIGQGIAAGYGGAAVTAADRALVDRLMAPTGAYRWVAREALIDAVTALSGSGPAYVFALVEAMAAAGQALGLPADLADDLARQTVIGAGALMAAQPDRPAGDLRTAVTSPGGTTRAALDVLMAPDGLAALMDRAMHAAARRAAELAGAIA